MSVSEYAPLYPVLEEYYKPMTSAMIDCEVETGNKSVAVGASHLRNAASRLYSYITLSEDAGKEASIDALKRSLILATISYRIHTYCAKAKEFAESYRMMITTAWIKDVIRSDEREELRSLARRVNYYQDDAEKIFDRFERIDKAIMSGLGQGLAILHPEWHIVNKTFRDRSLEIEEIDRVFRTKLLELKAREVQVHY